MATTRTKKLVRKQPALNTQVAKLVKLKDQEKVLQADIKALQSDILTEMQSAGLKTTTTKTVTNNEDRLIKVTLVQGETVSINAESLRKQLTAAQWNKITHRVLDNKKLEDAMAEDVVSPLIVADCSTTRARAPYIRVTS